MRRRRARALALLPLLLAPGCGTLLGLGQTPTPVLAGLQVHADTIQRLPQVYALFLPIVLPDLVLSVLLDVALLPIVSTVAFARAMAAPDDRTPRAPAPLVLTPIPRSLAPPSPLEAYLAEQAAARARREAHERAFQAALAVAARLAPQDAARRAALVARRAEAGVPGAGPFEWLPERRGPAREARAARLRALAPASPEALLLAAHLDERSGATSRARARCERLLDQEPTSAVAWTIRGWCWAREGVRGRAEADLRLGAALATSDLDVGWAVAGLARMRESAGDPSGALALYDGALRRLGPLGPAEAVLELQARADRLR